MPKNPHADFSPVLKGYSGQSPFKFWCQLALPLTYDDSLSYYELLNKVVNYLNNTISDVANVEDNVASLLTSFTQLQDYVNTYFDELDIDQELRNVLDKMALDGTLDEILSPLIAAQLPDIVEDQIDGVVASQIDVVVAGQIDDSVEDLLPAAVAGEVGDWLDENLEPTSPPVDPTLSIANAAADAKVTGEKISELKTELINYGAFDVLLMLDHQSRTTNGVTYTWSDDNTSVNVDTGGSPSTGQGWSNYYVDTGNIPDCIVPGETYHVNYVSTDQHIKFALYYYNSGNLISSDTITSSRDVTIPSNTTGIVMRLVVSSNITINNATASISMVNTKSNKELTEIANDLINSNFLPMNNTSAIRGSDDLNDYVDKNVYSVSTPNSIANMPVENAGGVLFVIAVYNMTFQIFLAFSSAYGANIYLRRYFNSTWTDWRAVKSTINVLPSENNADVSTDIQNALNTYKICRLGPGNYFVKNIDMPEDSAIIGEGASTKIYLIGNDNEAGYCFKMNSRCTIKNVSILGNTTDYTGNNATYPSNEQYVERNGIVFEGDYSSGATYVPRRGFIESCFICNFTGSGIKLRDTSPNVISGISISNVTIWHCHTGINIAYRSEFNKIDNCACNNCHFGVVNNGGNNIFSNCNFSKNIVGFVIDNSSGDMTNNSHGSVVNCIFDHSDGNNGTGILLIGVSYGEIFTGCQLFYSKIELTDCNGVVFNGLNAGSGETINIDGGTKIVFIGCMFRTSPTIDIDDNTLVTFVNCYCYDGTVVNP